MEAMVIIIKIIKHKAVSFCSCTQSHGKNAATAEILAKKLEFALHILSPIGTVVVVVIKTLLLAGTLPNACIHIAIDWLIGPPCWQQLQAYHKVNILYHELCYTL